MVFLVIKYLQMISKATLADTTALNILINSAYRGESSKKGWTTEADLLGGVRVNEAQLTEIIKRTDAFILKYTDNDKILASVYLENQVDKLYLGMLTVSPELQGIGIGKKLLHAAKDVAHTLGLKTISITVISVRAELIAWYERHGYVKTGETKPFPMDDPKFGEPTQFLEFIVMEKNL
jgi:ribosomal protein S18 acetylase RimI-like enzyme